jgi:GTP cyclohydrolase I
METKHTNTQIIENTIKSIFEYIGENFDREGLKDTPKRILKVWDETLKGYNEARKPKITTFKNGSDGIIYNQMIIDSGDYYSYCEHHFLPFFGNYYFGYIPNEKGLILGLSKVARIVDYYSSKLQIQERLTSEIVNELWNELCKDKNKPLGMILVMSGEHLCKTMRGVKKKGKMKTSYLKGIFEQSQARNEFLQLIKI